MLLLLLFALISYILSFVVILPHQSNKAKKENEEEVFFKEPSPLNTHTLLQCKSKDKN